MKCVETIFLRYVVQCISCVCAGGETAEMPGMYDPGVYDIAGFALGVVERSHILPKINDIAVSVSLYCMTRIVS